jgi:glycosyltransferase involved in cell wall biosynthesis
VRILFTRFPLESALGGAENQTLWLMEGLIERGHAVAFAGSCPVLLAECRKRNIPVAELDIGKPPVTRWEVISFGWRKKKMRRILQAMFENFSIDKAVGYESWAVGTKPIAPFDYAQDRLRPKLDAIVMLSLSEKLLLTDIAADAGTQVIWIEHDTIGRWLTQNPWLSLLLKQSQKAITVAVSELSRKMYIDLGWNEEKTIAIPNGVELRNLKAVSYKLSAMNSEPKAQSPKLHLGCIARLSKEKGVDVLINAMADTPKDVHLEVIGTGREESSLKSLTRSLHLDDRVTFTQRIPNISDAYGRFDALVLPSREHDPFGLVAAEAMLVGLPVIVTDACGIAGYLEDGKDAMVVKADSVSALSKAIQKLWAMSTQRTDLAAEGRKTAAKKFSVKTMVERYEDVFTGTSPRS